MTSRAARDLLFRASRLALVGFLLSCRHQPPPTPSTLEVEYRGCWAFYLPNQVCSLFPDPNRRLNLWVKTTSPNGKVEIRAGGRLLGAAGDEVSGGRYYRLAIPKPADRLTVSVLPPDGSRGPSWSLRLAEPDLRKEQSFSLQSLALRARNDGNPKEEEKWLLESFSFNRAEGRWSGEAKDAAWLTKLYTDQGRFSDAEKILEKLQSPSQAPADSQQLVAYSRGLLADAVGDYRSALEQLRKAADLADRIRMTPNYRWDAEQVLARILQDLGRSREASTLFESLRADPHPSNPCDLGTLMTNEGWSLLLAHEAGEEAEAPTKILEQARDAFEQNACTPDERLNAHLNLALAYQQEARWPEAGRELEQARALHAQPNLAERFWWDDLEARAAISEGQAKRALDLYKKLERESDLAASPAYTLRSELGLAKADLALGQRNAAIDALAQADRQIGNQSRHIPIHEGRDTFFAYQEAATRSYLDLLLKDQQWQRAFDLARQSRSRLLRQLAVRDRLSQLSDVRQKIWLEKLSTYRALRDTVESDAANRWQLTVSEKKRALEAEVAKLREAQEALDSALDVLPNAGEDKLSAPAPGEVILAYHPLPEKRWVAFAATAQGIEVATFDLPAPLPTDPADLSRLLLKPSSAFRLAIKGSKSVRVLPYGSLRSVDFHALPFDGDRPLLATHLVTYSLDLPVHAPQPLSGQPTALVVSNPTSDLRTAEGEGKTVVAAIQHWNGRWKPDLLNGPAAQSDRVLRVLPGASFFHYAGHGTFGGFAGWSSELPLANRSRLTLSDVLSLTRTPDWIVLSACDAAHTSEEAPGEGVGLASAFLLAGSKGVVAARQRVPDPSANALMYELYSKWRPEEDLQHQLRRAQLACRDNHSSCQAAWASFRFLVP